MSRGKHDSGAQTGCPGKGCDSPAGSTTQAGWHVGGQRTGTSGATIPADAYQSSR